MKTIFGLFDTFGGAKEGIEALLEEALQEFNVPQDVAGDYQTGVNEGGLLFWIRVEGGQAAAAANALRTAGATQVSDYSSYDYSLEGYKNADRRICAEGTRRGQFKPGR